MKTALIRVVLVNPITKPYTGGAETTLDLEVLSAGAPNVDHIDVYEGSEPKRESSSPPPRRSAPGGTTRT